MKKIFINYDLISKKLNKLQVQINYIENMYVLQFYDNNIISFAEKQEIHDNNISLLLSSEIVKYLGIKSNMTNDEITNIIIEYVKKYNKYQYLDKNEIIIFDIIDEKYQNEDFKDCKKNIIKTYLNRYQSIKKLYWKKNKEINGDELIKSTFKTMENDLLKLIGIYNTWTYIIYEPPLPKGSGFLISTCGCLIKTSKISKEDSIKQMVLHLKIVTGTSKDNIVIT